MRVLIVCAVGMSSSAFAEKVRETLKKKGIEDILIGACGSNQAVHYARQADLVLIAPQISYLKDRIEEEAVTRAVVIPTDVYGLKDTDRIAELILHPESSMQEEHIKGGLLRKAAEKIGSSTVLLSIRDGMTDILPVTVAGSVFSLLQAFPFSPWTDFLEKTGLSGILQLGNDMTIGMVSLYAALTISYHGAKYRKRNGTGVGLTAMICFFLMADAMHEKMIDMTFLGARGLFTAVLAAVFVSELFPVLDRISAIRPDSRLPKNIGESFRSLFPALVCVTAAAGINVLVLRMIGESIPALIDHVMTEYVTGIAGTNAASYLAVTLFSNLLWFFGLHGGQITSAVTTPIYKQLALANISAWQAGRTIPFLISGEVFHIFVFGGAGSTLPLAFLMMKRARSRRLRSLGRISFPMGLFFINEPLIFGIPIMLNPLLFLPFVLIPIASGALTFALMRIGLLPYMIGFDLPWTTPPILYGLLQGSVRLALWQGFLLVLQTALWYPFFRYMDLAELSKEKNGR